ncbi:MAG: molybdopterin biosynthesis protein [Gemmataceae bacterium]|nr:molybdopterin biosynthesis protein [Gemmataceae bacterium]
MDPFRQSQFLSVLDRDEADRRFRSHLDLSPLDPEAVPLADAHGRVLAADVRAPVDVPGFDRSNVDGFAVRAEDTFGAAEDGPVSLALHPEAVGPGRVPAAEVVAGLAVAVATGAVVPRGASAVVMVEHTDVRDGKLVITRPAAPGANVTFAGTDIGRGETVLYRGTVLTSRETGVLAALGIDRVGVVRRPRVGIISTGDEVRPPGEPLPVGCVYDSNATVLADAVRELGGEPVRFGVVPDDIEELRAVFAAAVAACDAVLLSGGTSKGAGDVSYRVVGEAGPPGVVAHGVALKPGKPLCLAVVDRGPHPPAPSPEKGGGERRDPTPRPPPPQGEGEKDRPTPPSSLPAGLVPPPPAGEGVRGWGPVSRPVPVAVLPGFPTSAVFTFHEFVAPVLRALAGRPAEAVETVTATLPVRLNSERGRTEYVLVGLVPGAGDSKLETRNSKLVAVPMGKGSGSVTAFGRADGFVTIPRQREYLEAGEAVEVRLLGAGVRPADLVVIGSHCVGLDLLLGRLRDRGFSAKVLSVGSTAGLEAAKRGECDLAGVHLLDPATEEYNRPLLVPGLELIPGYGRLQGVVFRPGDERFEGKTLAEAVTAAVADPACVLANRNRGSGTRVLIDGLLAGAKPAGFLSEAKSHSAVAAAVAQGRADWGVAIEPAAREYGLGFLPVRDERFDFVVPAGRTERPAVRAFREALSDAAARQAIKELGFNVSGERGA